nr:unnamed protein product [Callosobruchus analis]
MQRFWMRWSSDYLHQLQARSKWTTTSSKLKEGDLVLLIDDDTPPLHWKRGRIIQLHVGDDGLARTATILTARGNVTRAVQKLAVLPVDNEDVPDQEVETPPTTFQGRRNVTPTINCNEYARSLTTCDSSCMLLNRKNRGGLTNPTKDVKICMVAESIIKAQKDFSIPNTLLRLVSAAIRSLNIHQVFLSLSSHSLDQHIIRLDGHIIQLVRLILKNYFTIRLHDINATKKPNSR